MSLLAKLADLKAMLGLSETTLDAQLTLCLQTASSQAEQAAGTVEGGLRRQTGIVEYPASLPVQSRYARLAVRPIESVSSVKQASSPADDDEFADLDDLIQGDDYLVTPRDLERIGSAWWLQARCLRVVYNAGYLNPATTVVAWATATAYAVGDLVTSGGSTYACLTAHTSAAAFAAGSQWAAVRLPPMSLQYGVLQQAARLFQLKDTAGVEASMPAGGGSSVPLAPADLHPSLVSACAALRLWS